VNAWLAVALLATASGAAPGLPSPPAVDGVLALAPRATSACNAAIPFEKAERAYFAAERDHQAPLERNDPVLAFVLEGMACRAAEFPYSRTLASPPTDQRIPATFPYRAATETFMRTGREHLRARQLDAAEAEFRKAIVLGRLLYEEPGFTIIQDAISMSILARGAEGLGDVALARGDRKTAALCARYVTDSRAYLEGATRFTKALPYAALLDEPQKQAERVAEIAALDDPALRLSLRGEILLFVALARPLLKAPVPAADAALERSRRDPDARFRTLGEWASRLDAESARRIIRELGPSPFR
jgi:hypothetical protein